MKHVIAVIARDMNQAPELVNYVRNNPNIEVQLHCWEHIDYTVQHDKIPEHLKLSVKELEKHLGVRPTIWYPPWNKTDEKMEHHAANMGMTVSTQTGHLAQYIRKQTEMETISLHYWADEDCMLLETALQIYTKKQLPKAEPFPVRHDGHV